MLDTIAPTIHVVALRRSVVVWARIDRLPDLNRRAACDRANVRPEIPLDDQKCPLLIALRGGFHVGNRANGAIANGTVEEAPASSMRTSPNDQIATPFQPEHMSGALVAIHWLPVNIAIWHQIRFCSHSSNLLLLVM